MRINDFSGVEINMFPTVPKRGLEYTSTKNILVGISLHDSHQPPICTTIPNTINLSPGALSHDQPEESKFPSTPLVVKAKSQ